LDPRIIATFFWENAFGMPHKDASLYKEDKTGHSAKPLPGTYAAGQARPDRAIRESSRRALTGPGLQQLGRSCEETFSENVNRLLPQTVDWIEMEDLWTFIQDTIGSAVLGAIFGPALLERYPDFCRILFDFDRAIPSFVRMRSSRKDKAARNTLLSNLKTWSQDQNQSTLPDGDDSKGRDPRWGSEWTRQRHESFPSFFGDDAIAAHDLSLAWG
jgi:hypothetical protein